jgi:exonuclease III
MSRAFRIIQSNVRKQDVVLDSLMNDEEIQDASVLAIQEPWARRTGGRLLTTPMNHHRWTKMVPSIWREGRWPIRSMLWINKDVEAEQVTIQSPDITAAIIRLPERLVLAVSVYAPGLDTQALRDICDNLQKTIQEMRRKANSAVELVIVGDFNRHDQLWGGDEVSAEKQGEADLIIDLMNEFSLSSLLRRGTKTWRGGGHETTIDLVLASEELKDAMVKCTLYGTEHGSDHRTIETVFDVSVPIPRPQERLLLKNAPWKEINARIASSIGSPLAGTVQQKTDRLMAAVSGAVHTLTPKAKPSPYAKRWWTSDLTQLRRIYTYWRNRARAERRGGRIVTGLEETAKDAAKQYHDAIRQQKKKH